MKGAITAAAWGNALKTWGTATIGGAPAHVLGAAARRDL